LLALVISGLKWASGLQGHLDILLADEAEYLRNGLNLFDKIAKNWGPTYNIWYKLLSFFQTDPVALYYFNYKIGVIGVGILLFVCLIRYNIHLIAAFLIAFCYLFSDVNINAWPRISNFVLILFLLYFILVRNITSNVTKVILFSIVTFVAAFARPELLIVAEISGIVAVLLAVRDYKNIPSKIPLLLLLFATAIVLFFVYGKPADTYSNINRMYIAFCQHYAIAYRMRTHSNLNAIIEWIDFTKPLFGDCKTVPEILMKHFTLCIPHFLFTLKMYIVSFALFVLNFVTPLFLIPGMKKKQVLIGIFILFVVIALFNKNIRNSFTEKIKAHKLILFLSFAFSIPSMGICVVIFPRQHYIMMQAIWVALLIGFLLSSILEHYKINRLFVLPLAIVLFFLSPKATKFNTIQAVPEMKNLCTQKFIQFMNTQKWNEKHTIFSNILNVHLMFDEPEKFEQFNTEYMLKQLPATVTFKEILADKKIDIIVMNQQLMEETRLMKDTTWLNLTAHPENYQFKKVKFANECESYLLIKE
jgi:hypothetical protein